MPKENVLMKQLVLPLCSECSAFDGRLRERADSTQIQYISTTLDNLFALHPWPAVLILPDPVLSSVVSTQETSVDRQAGRRR